MHMANLKMNKLLSKEVSIHGFCAEAKVYKEGHGEIVRGRKSMWKPQITEDVDLNP